jgi:hypothetical protein
VSPNPSVSFWDKVEGQKCKSTTGASCTAPLKYDGTSYATTDKPTYLGGVLCSGTKSLWQSLRQHVLTGRPLGTKNVSHLKGQLVHLHLFLRGLGACLRTSLGVRMVHPLTEINVAQLPRQGALIYITVRLNSYNLVLNRIRSLSIHTRKL